MRGGSKTYGTVSADQQKAMTGLEFVQGLTDGTLPLNTIAETLGYDVTEAMISRDHLYIADEVFVSGTAAECVALREIDFRSIGAGKMGPVTRAIQKAYQAAIHGQHPRSAEWLDYVDTEAALKLPVSATADAG